MSRKCEITGKKPMFGQNVSHANNKTKRRFNPNLHTKRVFIEGKGFVKMRISARGLRTLDKKGK